MLDPEGATADRTLSARANYLAQDRPDVAYATKELCREFARPTRDSYNKLKRVGRYLAGNQRLAYNFKFLNEVPEFIDVFCDTDFAGCQQTRRSSSGGVALIGPHNVKHWSKTQTTVSLSSGEAELHGICAGVSQGLGLQQVLKILASTTRSTCILMLLPLSALPADAEWANCDILIAQTCGCRKRSEISKLAATRFLAVRTLPMLLLSM